MAKTRAPVLIARVGWMSSYDSSLNPDEPLIGGGGFNDRDVGSERENFRKFGRRVLGYVETRARGGGINLDRLGALRWAETVDGVLVILVARHPTEGKQRIIGWYDGARCHASAKRRSAVERGAYGVYNLECATADITLLEPVQRLHEIPKGRGAMGQSNVCYGEYPQARGADGRWIDAAVEFVRGIGKRRARRAVRSSRAPLPLRIYLPVSEDASTRAPKPFTKDPELLDRALRIHRRMQNKIDRLARRYGLTVVQGGGGWPDFDIGWIEGQQLTVVEIKSLDVMNEVSQLRFGIGQLLDYADGVGRRYRRVRRVLAVEREPSDPRWIRLCRAAAIELVWPETFLRLFQHLPTLR